MRLQLTGPISQVYDVYYRVHVQNIGWMAWAKNWQISGTSGMSYRIEALQIQIVKKGDPIPSSSGSTSFPFLTTPTIKYSSHVQNIGWQTPVENGATSGTCLLYTSPSPRDMRRSRMPSSA